MTQHLCRINLPPLPSRVGDNLLHIRRPPCCAPLVSQATEAAAAIEAAAAAEEVAEAEAANAVAASIAPPAEGLAVVGSGYGGGPQAWIKLRQLLRCAEPYCHPSNSGGWSSFIGYLLQALCQFTSWRGETA